VEEVVDSLELKLRDYQSDAVERCLENGMGTVVAATGAGKSLVQASLLENWKMLAGTFRCLLIVPGLALVNQLVNDFESYGVSFSYSGWTGGTDLQDTEVVIVNSENFCSQFGNFKKLLNVDLVLVDECHKTKQGNVVSKYISKIKTPHKYGFTGTLPKNKIDEWKIIGTFGPVIYEKDSKSLRDEKYLANVEVRMLKLNHKTRRKSGYKSERAFLEKSQQRMDLVVNIANKLKKNVLILVDRLEYGEKLREDFHKTDNHKTAWFISGEMPVETRQKIIDAMEQNNDIVCIAMSSIFSTGINIKNLHYIIFIFGGKSFIRTIQSIGRGLRLHESKHKLVLFDLYDNMEYSEQHAEERKQFYDEESIPWVETIVNL
jgi:superfamily II DNA or RNA helicase